jgi:HAD superfamily hydrolase (TIGR01509 family)
MGLVGVVMDLDGTLVDSRLDFPFIRADLGLPAGAPILEAIESGPPERRKARHNRLLEIELRAAAASTLFPGVAEFWQELSDLRLRTAVFTRNARVVAEQCLALHGLRPDLIVAREDAPPKPDPTGLRQICGAWGCLPAELVYLGDYLYDLEAGARAGIPTLLFSPGSPPPFADQAFRVFRNFEEAVCIVREWPAMLSSEQGEE